MVKNYTQKLDVIKTTHANVVDSINQKLALSYSQNKDLKEVNEGLHKKIRKLHQENEILNNQNIEDKEMLVKQVLDLAARDREQRAKILELERRQELNDLVFDRSKTLANKINTDMIREFNNMPVVINRVKGVNCPICLKLICVSEKIKTCCHSYHSNCLLQNMILNGSKCCVCRQELINIK